MHFFSFYPAEPSNQSYLSIFTILAGAPGNGRSSCANNHGCQGDYFINALLSFFKGSVKVVEEVNGFQSHANADQPLGRLETFFFFPLVCVVAVQLKFQALPSSACYLASSSLPYTLPVAITAFKLRIIIPASTDLLAIRISENALPLACTGGNGEEDQNVPIQRSRHCHRVWQLAQSVAQEHDWRLIHHIFAVL